MPKATQSYFEIRSSPIQGRGAFALRRIRKGTRIVEYVGEHISHDEADRRYDEDGMKRHHTFLFTLNRKTVVDAAVSGNESRFINHSCDPNCEAVIEDGRIYVESIKTIQPGKSETANFPWQRNRTLEGCGAINAKPGGGGAYYTFEARLGNKTSPKAVFQLN